jgi:hypothetical protein
MISRRLHRVAIFALLLLAGLCGAGHSGTIEVPSFLAYVPQGHFAGISAPSKTLSEARRSAVNDVVRQILDSIGASYSHRLNMSVYGSPKNPQRMVSEDLKSSAKGIVKGVSSRIVRSSWIEFDGKIICFILVKYPSELIAQMRRLTLGSIVTASVVGFEDGKALIQVSEGNGVKVTFTAADVLVRKHNCFAKKISYFVMKVADGSSESYRVGLEPVSVRGESTLISIGVDHGRPRLSDYLLGADIKRTVILSGFDEIGRKVSVKVSF